MEIKVEMTPMEALEDMKECMRQVSSSLESEICVGCCDIAKEDFLNDVCIIKQALEENEVLKNKTHAFNIIKDNQVNVYDDLIFYNTYNEYYENVLGYDKEYILNREDWEFLKEMMK